MVDVIKNTYIGTIDHKCGEKKSYTELQAEEINNVILLIKGNETELYEHAASARQKFSASIRPNLEHCAQPMAP